MNKATSKLRDQQLKLLPSKVIQKEITLHPENPVLTY